jgi:hypothetical protein
MEKYAWLPNGFEMSTLAKSTLILQDLPSLDQLRNATVKGKWGYRRVKIFGPSLFLGSALESRVAALFDTSRNAWSTHCNSYADNKEVYLISSCGKDYVISFKDDIVTLSLPENLVNDEGTVSEMIKTLHASS